MGALIVQDDALEQISFMLDKHESLVWYARKPPASDTDFWDKLPADVKKHALDVVAQVQEIYPDEIDRLTCENCGDWEHGFNSGVLAALRFVLHAAENPTEAVEQFPELDT